MEWIVLCSVCMVTSDESSSIAFDSSKLIYLQLLSYIKLNRALDSEDQLMNKEHMDKVCHTHASDQNIGWFDAAWHGENHDNILVITDKLVAWVKLFTQRMLFQLTTNRHVNNKQLSQIEVFLVLGILRG